MATRITTTMSDPELAGLRAGLPEHLRVLLADYPQSEWAQHRHFSDLTRYWLERHQMFRKALLTLQDETAFFLDGDRAGPSFARLITHVGGFLINELHAHHHIEDDHFFPILSRQDSRLTSGFALLESDHQQLDQALASISAQGQDMVAKINARNEAALQATDRLLNGLNRLSDLLNRHLIDEEELIVPIILAYNPDLE